MHDTALHCYTLHSYTLVHLTGTLKLPHCYPFFAVVDGVLYWAVSCFNYGDDPVFNRQRYGPAWIVTSHDNGQTFNLTATPTDMFKGRLAAPRFVPCCTTVMRLCDCNSH